MIGMLVLAIGRGQTVKLFLAKVETSDLMYMAELLEHGTVRSVIDRHYPLSETVDALSPWRGRGRGGRPRPAALRPRRDRVVRTVSL
jgi:NADPH:quinone reductase-like Zn-dependent oxidoreductase